MNETIRFGKLFAQMLHSFSDDLSDGVSNKRSGRGSPDLVGHNAQFVSLACQTRDGAQEVRSGRGIDPRCAHNKRRAVRLANLIFSGEFARTVGGQRPRASVLLPWPLATAVKHIIGREMDQGYTARCGPARHCARRIAVHLQGQLAFIFSLVDRRIGSRVDDKIWRKFVQGA